MWRWTPSGCACAIYITCVTGCRVQPFIADVADTHRLFTYSISKNVIHSIAVVGIQLVTYTCGLELYLNVWLSQQQTKQTMNKRAQVYVVGFTTEANHIQVHVALVAAAKHIYM